MILLDSNVVIYLFRPATRELIGERLRGQAMATCNVVRAEVLGYPALAEADEQELRDFLDALPNLVFDEAVTETVIAIRRNHRIPLPDAIIAGTAMVHDAVLWTHNSSDFQGISGLRLFDPLG